MTTWVSSDLHFNHKNIIQYCPNRRSGRPIPEEGPVYEAEINSMNELIINNWNSVVSPEDECYLLGDVAMGKIINAPELIRRLNGKKYLILGNHDKSLKKLIRSSEEYSEMFVWIRDVFEMTYKFENKKVPIFMSHYPHAAWPWMDSKSGIASLHLHGHLHGSPSGVTGRIKDVGSDTNNLFPYRMDSVVEELLKINVTRSHHRKEILL